MKSFVPWSSRSAAAATASPRSRALRRFIGGSSQWGSKRVYGSGTAVAEIDVIRVGSHLRQDHPATRTFVAFRVMEGNGDARHIGKRKRVIRCGMGRDLGIGGYCDFAEIEPR